MTTIKRYALSSLTTFLTAFLGAVALQMSANGIMVTSSAFWLAILTVGARAGIKALVEYFAQAHADPVAPTV